MRLLEGPCHLDYGLMLEGKGGWATLFARGASSAAASPQPESCRRVSSSSLAAHVPKCDSSSDDLADHCA